MVISRRLSTCVLVLQDGDDEDIDDDDDNNDDDDDGNNDDDDKCDDNAMLTNTNGRQTCSRDGSWVGAVQRGGIGQWSSW